LRIINIVENLDRGAVENWLVNVFLESRKMKPDWEWTFYCILGRRGMLDAIVEEAGGLIIYSPCTISDKITFLKNLRYTLKKGKYDIIHSHHDFLSGFYLIASIGISFKKRILHIHNTDKALPVGNSFLHDLLLKPLKKMAIHFSDIIVGISNNTLNDFIKGVNVGKRRKQLLYYGVKMSLPAAKNNHFLRNELCIPSDAMIMLFVGRMNEQKNPAFVMEILREIHTNRNDIYAVFVGKGIEEKTVLQKSREYNLENFVRLLGWRNDTAAIMTNSDVFVFPRAESPKEGLGLVVVEAQVAGLPMVLSYGIVEDAIEINELAHFVSLNNNSCEWALEVLKILNTPPAVDRESAYTIMKRSKFNLTKATGNLLSLYE
jgi:glycosyltransferase EpsF